MFEDSSEVGPRGTFETYRAEGDTLFKNGAYKKAIESYTTALELKQDDKDCFVARSRCHLQLGDTHHALADAEASLKDQPTFHKGLFQKAEALYCKGEFELALVFYHRGHKMRPELQEFRLGIQKAQEAIDNSVGSPEKVHLTKEGDLSFFEQLTEPAKKGRGKTNYPRRSTGNQVKQKDNTYKPVANDKTVKQLLGELYGDRVYLEKLLKETDPNSQTGRNIYDLVCDGLQYLDTRTEFWRQQKPMYARKRERHQPAGTGDKTKDKNAANQYVIKELEKIDEEQCEGRHADSLKRAKRCMKTVHSYPEDTLHNREDIVANLHSCMGNAYLEMGEIDKSLHHHSMDMEIADKDGLEEAKSRALDNLGRVYARSGQYQKAIDVWQEKLPLTKAPLESTWLYHEIGRCYLEMGKFEEAKNCGEKSASAANEANDNMWHLNATVLIAQTEVKMKEYQLSLGSFEKALDLAKLQGDVAAEAAIKKAIDDVNNKIIQGIKQNKEENNTEKKTNEENNTEKKTNEDEKSAKKDSETNDSEKSAKQDSETNDSEDKDKQTSPTPTNVDAVDGAASEHSEPQKVASAESDTEKD